MRRSRSATGFAFVVAVVVVTTGCEGDNSTVSFCSGTACCREADCSRLEAGGPVLEPLPAGALYFADVAAPAIYRLSPVSGHERIAGTGEAGSSPDGVPAALAAIGPPEILGIDAADGGLVFRDLSTGRVRKIDAHGLLAPMGDATR